MSNLPLPQRYYVRQRMPGWNGPVNALHEYRVMRSWGINKDAHFSLAIAYLSNALKARKEYRRNILRCFKRYGNHGAEVSGIAREHFPAREKAKLRDLNKRMSDHMDASLAHWSASGKRNHTWRRLRDTDAEYFETAPYLEIAAKYAKGGSK
jgi:hypothetical protein